MNLLNRGAAELAQLIVAGQATAVDAVAQHIAQINKVNPQLNAMVWDCFDAARAAATAADAKQQRGEPLGPLHGVPFTVKECLDLPGTPSTFGLESRKGHRATQTETHVARLVEAGAIPLCKTNVSQFLLYYEADNPLYGRTKNPHNALRTPGGSSGGEGALIAAGASPLGIGTDIGGSVRIPAAFCGITSLKPTTGRCNDMGWYWGPRGQRAIASQVGILGPRTADVALGTQVINGPSWVGTAEQVLGDYRQVDVRQLHVAFYTQDGTFEASPAARRAVHEAATFLRATGAQVTEWQVPEAPLALQLYYGILGADKLEIMRERMGAGRKAPQIAELMLLTALPPFAIRLLRNIMGWVGQPTLATTLGAFGPNRVGHYWKLVEAQIDYLARFKAALDTDAGGPFDVILCPPCALPAYTHGASKDLLTAGAYGPLYNLLGYPAGVVPVTRVRGGEQASRPATRDIVQKLARQVDADSAGLPMGVQVVARPWKEDHALAVMQAIETEVRKTQDFAPQGMG